MEEQFLLVVQRVFSNWTALQLAVDHHMAGANSHQSALDFAAHIAKCCASSCTSHELQEVMEDMLDEEFDTICEDDSPKVIANLLDGFITLWNKQNFGQFEEDVNNLPLVKEWFTKTVPQSTQEMLDSSDDDDSVEMEEVDPGWTQVKSRKKR